jgi:hypothetical protein
MLISMITRHSREGGNPVVIMQSLLTGTTGIKRTHDLLCVEYDLHLLFTGWIPASAGMT